MKESITRASDQSRPRRITIPVSLNTSVIKRKKYSCNNSANLEGLDPAPRAQCSQQRPTSEGRSLTMPSEVPLASIVIVKSWTRRIKQQGESLNLTTPNFWPTAIFKALVTEYSCRNYNTQMTISWTSWTTPTLPKFTSSHSFKRRPAVMLFSFLALNLQTYWGTSSSSTRRDFRNSWGSQNWRVSPVHWIFRPKTRTA